MTDHQHRQKATDPAVPPVGDAPPAIPLPTIEQDLAVVQWLHCSPELPGECTGYLCDALLLWTLLGGLWPEPDPPVLHPSQDHIDALAQLHDRWLQRALAEPIARRLELATIGRLLGAALRCGRDPQSLTGVRNRETLTLQLTPADWPVQ